MSDKAMGAEEIAQMVYLRSGIEGDFGRTWLDGKQKWLTKEIQSLVTAEVERAVEQVQAELRIAKKKNQTSLANNLCPTHRDKQTNKPCLACRIEELEDALYKIAAFAPGNGDVCEYIARMARRTFVVQDEGDG